MSKIDTSFYQERLEAIFASTSREVLREVFDIPKNGRIRPEWLMYQVRREFEEGEDDADRREYSRKH